MPSLIHSEHRDNINPIKAGEAQEWQEFKGPANNKDAWVISAFPEMTYPHAHVGQALTVEDAVILTGRDEYEDPAYKLEFKVRNVGMSTIQRYSVNVWFLVP